MPSIQLVSALGSGGPETRAKTPNNRQPDTHFLVRMLSLCYFLMVSVGRCVAVVGNGLLP